MFLFRLQSRGSVGERFFQSSAMSLMLKKMKKRLKETADFHMNFNPQEGRRMSPPPTPVRKWHLLQTLLHIIAYSLRSEIHTIDCLIHFIAFCCCQRFCFGGGACLSFHICFACKMLLSCILCRCLIFFSVCTRQAALAVMVKLLQCAD